MIALYVRAGSRHETAAQNGVSHFLEHLFFRGSLAWPDTVAMNAAVESAGGSLNGITARDHGCYYTPIHPDEVGTGLAILGDLIRRPLLKEMDVEREVILEEILDEVDADGRDIDPDNLSKRIVFGDHPLGYKIAGTPESSGACRGGRCARITSASTRDRTSCSRWRGRCARARWRSSRRRTSGSCRAGRRAPISPRRPGRAARASSSSSTTTRRRSSRSRSPAHPSATRTIRSTSASGASSTTGSPPGSPSRFVERRGLAYSLHAGIDTFADAGMTVIDGACAPRKLPKVLEEVLRVLGALAAGPMPDEELLRVQRRHRMTLAFSLDSAADLAGWYGAGEVLSAPESFEERCRRVERVTPADVRRVAAETFRRRNLVAVVVGPSGRRDRAALSRLVASTTAIPT